MTNNIKSPRRITVAELTARIEREAENTEKKMEDAHFLQDGARSLRMMCRSKPDESEDFGCIESAAHVHGFLADDEELAMPEGKEVAS